MNSLFPSRCIFDHVAASPFRIAPEAADRLNIQPVQQSLTLEYVESPRTLAEYVPSKGIVRLGGGYMDSLWATSYLYLTAIRAYQAAQSAGKEVFGLADDPLVAAAYDLYVDRLNLVATGRYAEWPNGMAKPMRYPFRHSDGYAANELFLAATGWVLHHEIAHAMLGHEEGSIDSVREEKQADRHATEWVFAQPADASELTKRALGLATALLFLISLDLRVGRRTFTTHPPSWERLLDALDIAGIGGMADHTVFAFTFVMLDIHLAAHGVGGKIDRNGSFRDMCVDACMLLRGGALDCRASMPSNA